MYIQQTGESTTYSVEFQRTVRFPKMVVEMRLLMINVQEGTTSVWLWYQHKCDDQRKNTGSMGQFQTQLSHVEASPFTQEQHSHIVQLLTQHTAHINNQQ